MEMRADAVPGLVTRLGAIRGLARFVGRAVALVAATSTFAALWFWIVLGESATGRWFALTPELLLLLVALLVPAAVLWFFWISIRSIQGLPDEIRKLVSEGRLKSSELAGSLRGNAPQTGWRRGFSVVRSLLELRGLLFRSKGLLMAAGMAVRLRVFNPAFLAGLALATAATAGMLVLAAAGTILAVLT